MINLEQIVSDCHSYGEVIVAGDLNAHIGYDNSGTIRGLNPHGLHMANLIDQSSLYPVSIAEITKGPSSGGHFTTVDYILASTSHLMLYFYYYYY